MTQEQQRRNSRRGTGGFDGIDDALSGVGRERAPDLAAQAREKLAQADEVIASIVSKDSQQFLRQSVQRSGQ